MNIFGVPFTMCKVSRLHMKPTSFYGSWSERCKIVEWDFKVNSKHEDAISMLIESAYKLMIKLFASSPGAIKICGFHNYLNDYTKNVTNWPPYLWNHPSIYFWAAPNTISGKCTYLIISQTPTTEESWWNCSIRVLLRSFKKGSMSISSHHSHTISYMLRQGAM